MVAGRLVTAHDIANKGNMNAQRMATSSFVLTTFVRKADAPADILRVYIEGDGFAWVNRRQVSGNPTPIHPVALTLAVKDPHEHVVYIARPCQYTPFDQDRLCYPHYWSSNRFADEVITAINEAVGHYKDEFRASKIELVGFSGGGGVAALVAARRNDVQGLITVAGNLDHVALHEHHGVSQLDSSSLNAIDIAPDVSSIPQLHISGQEDEVVPTVIARDFAHHSLLCAKVHVVKGQNHYLGWDNHWKSLLKITRSCSMK